VILLEIEIFQLIGAMAALLAVNSAGTVTYLHWRIKKLETCIDRANLRLDAHIDRGD